MKQVSNTQEFYEVIEKHDLVVVYWYTPWCPDCFVIKPHLSRLEEEFPTVQFYKMNRDSDIALAKHLEIYGIPSFTVYKNQDEIGRLVNKKRKTFDEVKTFIENLL